jgi:hypothetical protein
VSGALAVLLAVGLDALGVSARLDGWLAARLLEATGQAAAAGFPKALPAWALWSGTTVLAFGLAGAMLTVAGSWRRVVLWLTTLALIAAWAPVLALAAHAPQVSAAFTAALWAGLCAWFYARSHILPAESPAPLPHRQHRANPT